ncbi:Re/Si-specific NAD(P)(+) transhydrogenase subunit alpha [Desmospora profundinema]|uniref:proton-translocating NAD(P)(+) transhydrogenase n=1 Tax=Desmospora profundinema TaxID=1571184 RepID=A0ABU1IPQ9_9BACL|nr:Re/Si-specific NAD(P)(+) transhydrogenase subunit alpha [Desmospora profundinema]MDR6226775.1 NAD(P) transhydrogenase subunit alpha [Desmospora profundinema]
MTLKIAVPKEITHDENRVALVPRDAERLTRSGMEVFVESGAGLGADYTDGDYEKAGATVVPNASDLYGVADVILKVQKPTETEASGHESEMMRQGAVLIALLDPLRNPSLVSRLADCKLTSFSMDMVPRITRSQEMDALSSQSTVAGYKAVLMAANRLGRMMPMMVTAAGSIIPAKVLVLGAGVAGLQAIATARRLGAVVKGFDVRAAAKEQVESLGAEFIDEHLQEDAEAEGGYARELSGDQQERNRQVIHRHVQESDIVITTALIPGRPAPLLVTKEMVGDMKQGAVLVDLAAETGGNCELTEPGEIVQTDKGVSLIGLTNLPATVPVHASEMYSRNISKLLGLMVQDNQWSPDYEDEILDATCITREGEIVHSRIKEQFRDQAAT